MATANGTAYRSKSQSDEPDRLAEAVNHGRSVLDHFRQKRRDLVLLYAGNYSEETSDVCRPVNFLDLFVRIYARALVAKEPRFMLKTHRREHWPAVRTMQDWANTQVVRMDLATSLQKCVLDALFQVGVVKIALATPADAALGGYGVKAGDPYVCPISLDDLVYDPYARDRGEFAFVGHQLRVPIDAVKDSKLYTAARKQLQPQDRPRYDGEGNYRTDTLSDWAKSGNHVGNEFEPMVTLYELYLPRTRRIVTLAADDAGACTSTVLRDVEWYGPQCGPYRWLAYGSVPDSPMPKGVLPDLVDLDLAANDSFRKLTRQAERTKQLDLIKSHATDDGQAVQSANDGDLVPVSDPTAIVQYASQGPNAALLGFFTMTKQLFAYFAGGMDSAGGLAPSAKTATQERLLADSASQTVADLQATTVKFTADVGRDLLWWWWHNPTKVMEAPVSPTGLPDVTAMRSLYPRGAADPATGQPFGPAQSRSLPFEELDLRVDPFSLSHTTPQSRSQNLKALVTQLLAPMLPILQQQGIQIDMNKLLTKLGEYDDEPDLADILNLVEPLGDQGGGGGDGGGMPSATSREYVRRSESQNDAGAQEAEVMGMMRQANQGGAESG